MTSASHRARALAVAFLSGEWHLRVMLARGAFALSAGGGCLRELAFDVRQRWPAPPHHDLEGLVAFLEAHPALRRGPPAAPRWLDWHPRMAPPRWEVRRLDTAADVAAWLGVDDAMLRWLADRKGLQGRSADEALQHYRRRWLPRGARLPRLLEAPKQRLKALQRKLLDEVLAAVPAHDAAHGFVRGRSVRTHAALHLGQPVVVRLDLQSFFTWLQPARALGLFRALGYPREVASLLLGLCTTRTPEAVLRQAPAPEPCTLAQGRELFRLRGRLRGWHLPQGAPTSPALANLTSWALDVRLQGLAARLGATYSRYADDLVFSGPATLPVGPLVRTAAAICGQEGHRLNPAKTRVQRAHRRQEVTGLVVNRHLAVPREVREALEAELYNLARGRRRRDAGETPGALRARLEGQVGWVAHVHPAHAAWMRELLGRIDWAAAAEG